MSAHAGRTAQRRAGYFHVSHQSHVVRVKFQELLDAFDLVSAGPPMENEAYLSKETGAVYWHSEYAGDLEERPIDIDDDEKYLSIPHKNDLGLGKALALGFTREFLANDLGTVREMFSRRGAYARFEGPPADAGTAARARHVQPWHR